jgi:hypothetical protein
LNKLFLSFILFASTGAWAYPEMVRHGYTNCIACHISPAGGGILTPYGKSLASELLTYNWSQSSKPNTANKISDPASEAVVNTWLTGGDARVLLFHRDNEYESSYQTIPMQVDVNGAYNSDKYAFVLGLGLSGSRSGGEGSTAFRIPNAYGLYRVTDEINVRGGIFLPAYGLNNSLHTIGTRAPLGFGFKDQRMGLEVSYLAEKWGLFVSQFGNRGNKLGENATTAQIQFSPTEKSKFAVNYWNENNLRTVYGAWFITPIYGPLYISADYDSQKETLTDTKGQFYYAKIGYELHQGMHLYLMSDHAQRDLDRSYTKIDRFGPGFQMFPFLHWEIDAVWLREKNLTYSKKEADYAYIMAHYYL